MNFKILQYEIKEMESEGWKMVSEANALELLQDMRSPTGQYHRISWNLFQSQRSGLILARRDSVP